MLLFSVVVHVTGASHSNSAPDPGFGDGRSAMFFRVLRGHEPAGLSAAVHLENFHHVAHLLSCAETHLRPRESEWNREKRGRLMKSAFSRYRRRTELSFSS